MGLHPKWGMSVKDVGLHDSNMWVAFELTDMILVGVYASGPQAQRFKIWQSICKEYEVPTILTGDFNMVDILEDRFQKRGK